MSKNVERFKLTKEMAIPLMRKAYEDGKLSAQGKTPACRYRDRSNNPCIIGACVPDEFLHYGVDYDPDIGEYVFDGLIEGDVYSLKDRRDIDICKDEIKWFDEIQRMHYDWVFFSGIPLYGYIAHLILRDMLGINNPESEDYIPENLGEFKPKG